MEVRNISIAFLQEIGCWNSDLVNQVDIESMLNIVDLLDRDRTFPHRKTMLEIFHSASAPGSVADGGDASSGDSTSSTASALCAFCRHLNLIYLCNQFHGWMMKITISTLGAFEERPSCRLCAFLLQSIAATFPAYDQRNPTWMARTASLRFASEKAHIDSYQGVKVYLCIAGESSEVLLRVYKAQSFEKMQGAREAAVPRPVPEYVNLNHFRYLAYDCFKAHSECLVIGNRAFPSGFRLIDVNRRKVARFRNGEVPPYLALSYVWGKNPDSKHLSTKNNIQDFECENSLRDLPQTIEDSFEVCRQFGILFLWVDRLCIVQDDNHHKGQQIDAMATIYQAAEIVIVAASASNLHDGLAGISKRRSRQPELLLEQEDLKIVASLPRFADVMQHSTWQSRGWTYQEAVLGRRKLYLTSAQAFFDCGEGRLVQPEDEFAEGSTFGMSLRRNRSTTLWQYYFHVDQYNRRELKYQSDVYKAIHGVMQTLYPDQSIFGLPTSDFDQALLWRGRSQSRCRSDQVTIPEWSWASTNSAVKRWPYLFLGTLVSWSVCVEKSLGEVELVSVEAKSSPETWLDWKQEFTCQTLCPQLAMATAWNLGCIDADPPFGNLRNNEYTMQELQTETIALWPTYDHFWDAAFANRATTAADVSSDLHGVSLPGTLIGRVQLKQFPISRHEKQQCVECNECINSGRLQIERTSTEPVGMIEHPHPDLDWIRARSESLYFAAISISEWQVSEKCFDRIPRDQNLCRFSGRSGEHGDSWSPRILWDARARLFRESGLDHSSEDDRTIWSLNAKLPLERPPLLVNVMMLDVSGLKARYVCKGWVFLSSWGSCPGEFGRVAITSHSEAVETNVSQSGQRHASNSRT